MQPKSIIIQTHSKSFFDKIYFELQNINCINFWGKKINGVYVITIKCLNYYKKFDIDINYNFIGSYIFLYSNLSLILSDLIISEYEQIYVNRIMRDNFFYFPSSSQNNIKNITRCILDTNSPYEESTKFYLHRKELILRNLLSNFRKRNFINIDAFVNFRNQDYINILNDVVDNSVSLFLSDKNYVELLKFIFQNLLY